MNIHVRKNRKRRIIDKVYLNTWYFTTESCLLTKLFVVRLVRVVSKYPHVRSGHVLHETFIPIVNWKKDIDEFQILEN